MTDIVQELRSAIAPSLSICLKAADEIERLRTAGSLVLADWDSLQAGSEKPRHCVSRSTIEHLRGINQQNAEPK